MSNLKKFKVALAQTHVRVGVDELSLEKNTSAIFDFYEDSVAQDCDLLLAPELSIAGYSPQDLMRRRDVQEDVYRAQSALVKRVKKLKAKTSIVFGNFSTIGNYADENKEITSDDFSTHNSLKIGYSTLINYALLYNPVKNVSYRAIKKHLPSWGVFDEARWFASSKKHTLPMDVNGVKVGLCVCRDIWIESTTRNLVENGAEIIVVPNASPYANGRHKERIAVVSSYAKKYKIPIIYVNMVSACDEVVFDGGSFAVNANGEVILQLERFQEQVAFVEIDIDSDDKPSIPSSEQEIAFAEEKVDLSFSNDGETFDVDETYSACLLGLRDFINGVTKDKGHVVIGLSGGIDSALVATMAVDAFGADRVHGVLMPSKFTSDDSNLLAVKLAENLGISHETISIEQMHYSAIEVFDLESKESIVGENVQSRLRGMTLMMLSNSRGWLPLATGNKSEFAVGYCTLYGDTVGAFSPIKDVYKTQVFELCKYRNTIENVIPQEIIDRPPTAELREGQKDSDSLPVYEILDPILSAYIQDEKSIEEIISDGFDENDVRRVIALVNGAEFKRKQAPLGTRLMRHNFGMGRRIPIVSNS